MWNKIKSFFSRKKIEPAVNIVITMKSGDNLPTIHVECEKGLETQLGLILFDLAEGHLADDAYSSALKTVDSMTLNKAVAGYKELSESKQNLESIFSLAELQEERPFVSPLEVFGNALKANSN